MAERKHAPAAPDQRQDAAELLDRLAAANHRVQRDTECRQDTLRSWAHENLLSAMVASVPDFLFIKDREGRYVMANRGLPGREITAEQLIGKTTWDVNLPDVAAKVRAQEQELFRSGEAQLDYESSVIDKKTGKKLWIRLSRIPLRDESGEIVGLVGVARDITAQKMAEEEVKFLAHHDPLTRLPNRSLLIDRLEQAILHAKRSGSWVAVGFIDLDNFKLINDGLGHAAGDELLKIAASRMVNSLRATDTVLRLGGDEFVIIFAEQPKSIDAISAVVEKVHEAIAAPMELAGQTIKVTSSMGLAIFPSDGVDAGSLLKNADVAMYQAKAAGRDNFQFFTAEIASMISGQVIRA